MATGPIETHLHRSFNWENAAPAARMGPRGRSASCGNGLSAQCVRLRSEINQAVSLDVMTGEVRSATFGYDAGAVAEWVRSADPRARCVYESGVTGFDLQKRLSGLGVDCVVGAVSKMIKPSADRRRKNDRNDAEFLARMLSVGNVVEVWVPDDECEAARDLTRALEDARDDLSRAKQRLSKFLLRHGLVFDERTPTGRRRGNWTRAHWSWIESIEFAERADNDVLAYYVDAVRRAAEDKARLEGLVEAEARKSRWRRRVDSLRCLKGVDTASAADLVFEAGEFSRFRNARSFAAWVGLTPSEHSSGESDRRGAITKAGNKHLRKTLVEAAWHYLTCSARPKEPARGQAPDPGARRHAAKGVRRLVERREALLARGVHNNKANVATARELACWVWAVGLMAEEA